MAVPSLPSFALMSFETLLPNWVERELDNVVRVILGVKELKDAIFEKLVMRTHPTWQIASNDRVELVYLCGHPRFTDLLYLGQLPWRVAEILRCVAEGVHLNDCSQFEGNVRLAVDERIEVFISATYNSWLIELYSSMLNAHYNGPEWDSEAEFERLCTCQESMAPQTIDGDCIRYGLHGCQHVLNLVDSDISQLADGQFTRDRNMTPTVPPNAVFTRVPRFRLIIEA